ncbi:LexA family protein [Holdemania filiformis]|uniref:LexA family protein n=1 Tax=Holdemania filiformis TaxID=61171 RepID=UPI00242C0453|nr:XRE family transcriptional regulator [Holdemania filiformis]
MPKNIQFGKMVERYMRLNKLTMKELGEKVGRGESTVSMWISNKSTPPMGIVQKLADLFGVTTDTMIYGDDYLEEIPIVFDDYFPLHYSTNLSAGTLEELLDAEPDAVVHVPIKYQMMKKRLHAFKVNGTSMNNVIADGSIVVCEDISSTYTQLKDGTIVVVLVDGLATVKRLYVRDNQVTLMPDSTDKSHLPIIINTDNQAVLVAGRVIWHMNPDDIADKIY